MKWSASHPLQLVLGPGLWLLWFAVAYGGLSIACAFAPPAAEQGPFTWVNAALLLLTALTAAALGWAAWASARAVAALPRAQRFLPWAGAFLYLVSAVSTLAVGLPLALLPPCV